MSSLAIGAHRACCSPISSAPTATVATPTVLAQRLAWRGYDAEVTEVLGGDPVPESGDVYVLGGGEDAPQAQAAREIGTERALASRRRARCTACWRCAPECRSWARSFPDPAGGTSSGAALLDIETVTRRPPSCRRRAARATRCSTRSTRAHGLREPRRAHPAGRRRPAARAPSRSVKATVGAPRARSTAGSSGPTCTARCWPATRRWPTCC